MQRQPTPRADLDRVGHFMHRDDALREASMNKSLLVDLSDLPSGVGDPKKAEAKEWAARDVRVAKEVGLRYWEGKKVRGFLVCYHCGKRRCIYSPQDKEYKTAQIALQQKFESVTGRFSCGSLLFDDGHHLSKILVQKQNLTCESPIEKGYYNNKERKLKLKDICVHCGEMGSKEFLLSLPEFQERCLTDGYN